MNKEYNDFYYLGGNNSIAPLQYDEQNSYIRLLKRKLREHNYLKGEINGQFDVDVRNAIMELQRDYGLALTGIIDDKVLEVLLNPSHISISKEEYASDDVIILEMKLRKVSPSPIEIKEGIEYEKKPILEPKEMTEKKFLEMLIPQEGIEALYPPFVYEENVYIVKPGDTLWSLARKFHTTVEEIMTINNLHNTLLSIGQLLIIPRNIILEEMPNVYIVKPGDTLWSLARKFHTTVEEIMTVNNLHNTLLSIGQQLIIPYNQLEVTTYEVQRGNTLWSIAKRFGTSVEKLKRINGLTSDTLSIGQRLIIHQ